MVKRKHSYFKTVFLLFFTAAILPIALLSIATTGLSANLVDTIIGTNVADSLESTGLKLVDFNERAGRGIVAVAANLQILAFFEKGTPLSEADGAKAAAVIRERFRSDEPPTDVYLVSLAGATLFSTSLLPGPYDAGSQASMELINRISERPAGITVCARKAPAKAASYISFSIATSIIGPSGKPKGYVIADVPRETLRTVLAPLPKIPELVLLDEDRFIAFSLSSPESEGAPYTAEANGTEANLLEYSSGRMKLIARKPAELVTSLVSRIRLITLLCFFLSASLALALSFFLSGRLSKPIVKLIEATRSVADGDLSVTLVPEKSGDIAVLMKNFNSMVADLRSLFDKTVEEQELLRRAELDSLRAQINPHFFFNALSSISALSKLGACGEITTVTTALGKLLRSSLDNKSNISTVGESLVETRNYLIIEKIRFADRFAWIEEIGEGLLDCEVPRLAIQSLVENALIHGIEPNPEPSVLTVRIFAEAGKLFVWIADTGVGMGGAKMSAINGALESALMSEEGAHIGLANANRRIRLEYGEGYGITLRNNEGRGIVALMTVPLRRKEQCIG